MKMRTTLIGHIIAMALLLLVVDNGISQVVFEDDFDNGNADTPVKWTPRVIPFSEYDATSGDYIFRALPGFDSSAGIALASDPADFVLGNTSVDAKFGERALFSNMGLGARWNEAEQTGYWNSIFSDGAVFIGRNDGFGNIVVLANGNTELDVVSQDVRLRFDAIGTTLRTWMWLPGDPMPQEPLLTAEDASYQSGTAAVYANPLPGGEATYRFVNVSVPEPSTTAMAAIGALHVLVWCRVRRGGPGRSSGHGCGRILRSRYKMANG